MKEILAYCGIICSTCPIFIVTREPDKEKQAEKRAEIAKLISEQYGIECNPSRINDCDGCSTISDRIFSGCKDCLIRKCAKMKSLENCAYCPEYSCEKLETFFIKDPQAKIRLQNVKKELYNR